MKASRLSGIAIVSIADGTKEGTVRDVVLEPNRRRVVALTIRPTGGRNDKLVPVKEIHSAGRDAITIPNTDVLKEEHPVRGDGEVYLSELKGTKALADTGEVVGTISEVEIDPNSFAILGYELTTGVWSGLTGSRKRLPADERVHYGRDVLIVRESMPAAEVKESRAEVKESRAEAKENRAEARAKEKAHSRRH